MTGWLGLIVSILQAVAEVTKFLGDRQLLKAGEAQAIADGLSQTIENVEKANAARADVLADPDGDYAVSVRSKYERKGE
jgi:hypothetical protein